MKTRYITLTASIVLAASILSACGQPHEHAWKDASCSEAKVCTECGETEGEPLGHQWAEATCTEPKTCKVCGETEGEPLGHQWIEATCTEAKTCEFCGETEGEPLGHDFDKATFDAPKTCKACGETEGGRLVLQELDFKLSKYTYQAEDRIYSMEVTDSGKVVCTVYDEDGNVLNTIKPDIKGDNYMLSTYFDVIGDRIIICGEAVNVYKKDMYYPEWCYDKDGNELDIDVNPSKLMDAIITYSLKVPEKDLYELFDVNMNFHGAYDLASNSLIDAEKYGDPVHDLSKLPKHRYIAYDEPSDLYLLNNKENNDSYDFFDRNGNLIMSCADAIPFTDKGYALITNDKKTYSVIDTDFNIIGENVVEGKSSYFPGNCAGNVFIIEGLDGKERYYKITESDETESPADNNADVNTYEGENTDSAAEDISSTEDVSAEDGTFILEQLKPGDTVSLGQTVKSSKGEQFDVQYWLNENNSGKLMATESTKGWDYLVLGSNDFYTIGDFNKEDILAIDAWTVLDGSQLNPDLDMTILYLEFKK